MGNDPANMIDPTGMKAQVGYGQEVNYMHDLYAPKEQGSSGGSNSQRYAEDWDYEQENNMMMPWKEKQDKDKIPTVESVNGIAKIDGVNYDLKAFGNFFDNNQVTATSYTNVYRNSEGEMVPITTSLEGATDFKLDGQPTTPLAEVNGNLVLVSSNTVTVGQNHDDNGNLTRSSRPAPEFATVSYIHTHMSNKGMLTFIDNMRIGRSITFSSGPSPGDKGSAPNGKYLNVVVDDKMIYLYNSTKTYQYKR